MASRFVDELPDEFIKKITVLLMKIIMILNLIRILNLKMK